MLNTEIGKTGEVIVEGHVIGRLDGFTFAPDAAEAGSDAKALQATAQKALAGEIEARAEKLSAAPDDQFLLTSDGTIRWTGDAVAKLVAAEDALHPRLRIIADERLTGAARESVQTRLDLWLKTHIEKLLGPLFDLSKAEDITGIARGIAFQLIEALGVLERAKISAEMKDLDQPSRATLRKYGVRFGAYHIYTPALLKPAARAIASLLWAQKHDDIDMSALSGAQHLAGSGRTSFPVDKQLNRDAYRVLGYRQCGERAVRVDILERLADLIRPALSWRESSPGEKPAGAFDGRGFVVTQAMTSLTGSAGEDFASILRALGYRMDRRPAPPPKPVPTETAAAETSEADAAPETVSPETLPSETTSDATVEAAPILVDAVLAEPSIAPDGGGGADAAGDIPPISEEPASVPSAALLPAVVFSPMTDGGEPAPVETSSTEVAAEPVASVETAAADAPQAETVAAGDASTTPEMVEVWRPGGRSEERRPRHDRNRHRPQEGTQAAPASEGGEGAQRERHRRGRRDRPDFRKPRTETPTEGVAATSAEGAPVHEVRDDKAHSPRERFHGKGRDKDRGAERERDKAKFGGGRDNNGRDNNGRDKGGRDRAGRDKGPRDKRGDGGPSHRPFASSAGPRDRDRPIDPNSPFAKLAALKEQLTANRKD
jgi:ATP-dependent RNA helicase SUPV3L1/SUV3